MTMVFGFSKSPVDVAALEAQIRSSSITVALDYVTFMSPDSLTIAFKSNLSPSEESDLSSIVSAHDGTPLAPEPEEVVLAVPKNTDDRPIFHTTPRKRGLFTCFTSRGDDPASNVAVSGGNFLEMNHQIGDQPTQSIYVHFNTIANETFAHAGSIQWKDALLDAFSLETVPALSTYEAGTNTYFNLYGGYLIIPAAGNGTINVTDMVLVEVPINEFGNRSGAGYWNAAFNTGTGEFENIAAAPLGDGQFNMFGAEVVLDRFVNKMLLLGSGFMPLDTYDSSMIGHNMKLKITLETRGDDHAWMWCGNLKPYRKKTV